MKTKLYILTVLFCVFAIQKANAQWSFNGDVTSGQYIGTNNNQPFPIRVSGTEIMRIHTNGNVGIGTTNPTQLLQVVGGNVDVNTATNSYMINSHPVLWYNSDYNNIYVGVGAGLNDGGTDNTFVGGNAGTANTNGTYNTFVGFNAGVNNTTANNNAFIGIGAGFHTTTGYENVFLGNNTGYANTTGLHNTCIGQSADLGSSNLNYSTAIGAYSMVTQDFSLILGSIHNVNNAADNTKVGIGTTAPQNFLHINNVDGANVYEQFSNSNTGATTTDGLLIGIDGSTGNAQIKQQEDAPIIFYEHGNGQLLERIRLTQGTGYYQGAPFSAVTRIGISWGHTAGGEITSPGAMLHLGSPLSSGGHRNWMDVGTYLDFNGDNGYFGLKDESATEDRGEDVVIDWGASTCENSAELHYFRIIHTDNPSTPYSCTDESSGTDGREEMRITANGNVGIGNFNALGSDPLQTLDVDGAAAIRTVAHDDAQTKVLVWNSGSDGLIEYRDVNTFGTGNVSACGTPTGDYITKWCSAGNNIQNSLIYDNGTNVGIGTTTPTGHLDVVNTVASWAIRARTNLPGGFVNYGIEGSSLGGSALVNVGVYGDQTTSANFINVGIIGQAAGDNLINVGGSFVAGNGCTTGTIPLNIGVYARAYGHPLTSTICGPGYAGYFQGAVVATEGFYPSDIRLKDSINNLSSVLPIIEKIETKDFYFKNDSFPYMGLPGGKQYGLIAQQVDTILPEIVTDIMQPQIRDSSGALLMDTMTFKAINYNELIPLAIRGIQELDSSKVASSTKAGDSNYVAKWGAIAKTLVSSQIYDNGSQLGMPATLSGAFLNVQNDTNDILANFNSTHLTATDVVKAVYNTNSSPNTVNAVTGSSNYLNASGASDGIGGNFAGGKNGVYSSADGNNQAEYGVLGEAKGGVYANIGVGGSSLASTSGYNVGVYGMADSSSNQNIGMVGNVMGNTSVAENYGLIAMSSGSTVKNVGGYFQCNDTLGTNYAVYGYAAGSAPNSYAGYFNGDVQVNGNLTWTSDAMLKTNVTDISSNDALSNILRLQPKAYQFRNSDYPSLSLPHGTQYGLIAQEVQQVLPQLVSDVIEPGQKEEFGSPARQSVSFKGLNYIELIPLLVGAVKEQQTKIDSLTDVINTRINNLEARLDQCCTAGMSGKRDAGTGDTIATAHQVSVELGALQVIVLQQNVPNPFAEQTSISYFIPDDVINAQVIFTDMLGRVIKTADLQSGYGVITVFASNLSTGQYAYSLLVDGKVVESRKMVKTK